MDDETIAGLFIGIVLGVFLIGVVFGLCIINPLKDDVGELGQAICEMEHGMDFESYKDDILKCQPMKEQYDGLQIDIRFI